MVGWWADRYLFSFHSCSFMQACNRDLISFKQSNYRKQGSVHQLLFVAPHLLTRGAFCSVQQLGRAPQFPTFVAEVQQEALFHTACVMDLKPWEDASDHAIPWSTPASSFPAWQRPGPRAPLFRRAAARWRHNRGTPRRTREQRGGGERASVCWVRAGVRSRLLELVTVVSPCTWPCSCLLGPPWGWLCPASGTLCLADGWSLRDRRQPGEKKVQF